MLLQPLREEPPHWPAVRECLHGATAELPPDVSQQLLREVQGLQPPPLPGFESASVSARGRGPPSAGGRPSAPRPEMLRSVSAYSTFHPAVELTQALASL